MARLQVAAIAIALFGLLAVASAGVSAAVVNLVSKPTSPEVSHSLHHYTASYSKQRLFSCPTHLQRNQQPA
jgi:hypothetical protein